jgi:shikimate dehydrogenase
VKNQQTRVLGLVGHRARYSLSPKMHNAMLRAKGVDAVYVLFDAHPEAAEAVAESLRTLDIAGVNLTVPFKERIVPFLDGMTVAAQEAGAVNLVIQVEGELTGFNTDGAGLLAALEEEHDWSSEGRSAVVLGAGGAARAVAASLAAAGAVRVTFLNRGLERGRRVCGQLQEIHPATEFGVLRLEAESMRQASPVADLVVNCLASGGEDVVRLFDVSALPPHAIWADINYWMADPPQLAVCRNRGLRVSDGFGMLVHQGAISFELFTGEPVTATEMRQALEATGCVPVIAR